MEERLLEMLTKMFGIRPIFYEDFNKCFAIEDVGRLRELEEEYNELGIYGYDTENEGISTVSIISTITRVLIGSALAFNTVKVRDNTGKERLLITGVCMYDKEIPEDIKTINNQNLKRFIINYGITPCENTYIKELLQMVQVDYYNTGDV
jgi:hypothetical protein